MAHRKITSSPIEPPEPPSAAGMIREGLGLLELPRLLLQAPSLARQPRGSGEPVMVCPGYGAGDSSTVVLRTYLNYLGYRTQGWSLGRNNGKVPKLIPRLVQRLRCLAREAGTPVRLIGWSLGGYLAREAARERPSDVVRVVTLGSPVVGGPKYTTVGWVYRQQGYDLEAIEAAVAERNRTPLQVPVTAIYSKADGIVAWQACIDETGAAVDHVEVTTTHVGLGFAPEVYRVIARSLAR
jgi:pimeloyl-ACP methyl ester carboxylesterase